jgi:glycosyltransferase involved in cell wall biosynthesis
MMHANPSDEKVLWRNTIAPPEHPRLSVVTPVYMHDATPLLRALAQTQQGSFVEIILIDDASPQAWPVAAIKAGAETLPLSIQLIEGQVNQGRSAARNCLLRYARADHILFLDADMIPDDSAFLDRWLDLITHNDPDIAFGGFTLQHARSCPKTALHRFVSLRSDCRSAAQRQIDPAQFTTTSNLLVKRSVLNQIPFDEAFFGWGWEDVDWALRASRQFAIMHVENTATHNGLDDTDALLRKAAQAGANYRRLVDKHPNAVQRFRSFQLAKHLSRWPFLLRLKSHCAELARFHSAPLVLRSAAYKLFRTLTYAESLR